MAKFEMDELVQKIKASSKAELGSPERAKDMLDSITMFLTAIEDQAGVDLGKHLGFLAHATVSDEFLTPEERERGIISNGLVLCRGQGFVLMAMIAKMLCKMAEDQTKSDVVTNAGLAAALSSASADEKKKILDSALEFSKVTLVQDLCNLIGIGAEVGVMDMNTKKIDVV